MTKGPLYQQIRTAISDRLRARHWGPGEMLPTEAELAQTFACSVGTLRKAIDGLQGEGVLRRVQGRGTFVVTIPPEWSKGQIRAIGSTIAKAARFELVRQVSGIEQACPDTAAALKVPTSSRIFQISRVLARQGQRAALETISIPAHLVPGFEQMVPIPEALHPLYQAQYGLFALYMRDQMSGMVADEPTARRLGSAIGTAVLRLERVTQGLGAEPIEHRILLMRADGVAYRAKEIEAA